MVRRHNSLGRRSVLFAAAVLLAPLVAGQSPGSDSTAVGVELCIEVRVEGGQAVVETTLQWSWEAPREHVELTDPAVAFYGTGSLPELSEAARSPILQQSWECENGRSGSLEFDGEGHCSLDVGGARSLQVRRISKLLDRSGGSRSQHPYSSSFDGRSGVLFGADLVIESGESDSPPVTATIVVPEGWRVATSLADNAPHTLEEWAEDFLAFGEQLAVHERELSSGHRVRIAVPADLDGLSPWSDWSARVLEVASEAFGPLPGRKERLIVLQRLRETENLRLLAHRGGNTPRSLVAYVDPRSLDRAEHPFAVVAHECVHWWNGRGLSLRTGENQPWFTEGATTYYELLFLARAEIVDLEFVLEALLELAVGDGAVRAPINLAQASARFARLGAATERVYRRGAQLAFLLDLRLRRPLEPQSSLDRVVAALVAQGRLRGRWGLPGRAIADTVERMGGEKAMEQVQQWLLAEEPLPLDDAFAALGYSIERGRAPVLGVRLAPTTDLRVGAVLRNGPCAEWVLPEDVLRRLDDVPLSDRVSLERSLADRAPGQSVKLVVERDGVEVRGEVVLGSRPRWTLGPRMDPLPDAARELERALLAGR